MIASVESTIVPSMSKSIPVKVHISGGADKPSLSPSDSILDGDLSRTVLKLVAACARNINKNSRGE